MRSSAHAPDQTIRRSQLLHCPFDLAATTTRHRTRFHEVARAAGAKRQTGNNPLGRITPKPRIWRGKHTGVQFPKISPVKRASRKPCERNNVLRRPAVAIHYCFARGLGGVVSVRAGPSFGSHAYRAVRMNLRLSDVRQGAPSESRISVRPDAFVRTDSWLVRKSTWEA